MKEKKPSSGKIELQGKGMGVPSPEDIERRAREIAMIDERNAEEFTDADWSQAREELMGSENNEPPEEPPDNPNVTGEWEVTPDDRGHRVPRSGSDDEKQTGGETLFTDVREVARPG